MQYGPTSTLCFPGLSHWCNSPRSRVTQPQLHQALTEDITEATNFWKTGQVGDPPSNTTALPLKSWDTPVINAAKASLLSNAPDNTTRSRLLATGCKETGACLQAPPISALGLRLDNESFRINISTHLGTPVCSAHLCQHCGVDVDHQGLHGLSCRKIQG